MRHHPIHPTRSRRRRFHKNERWCTRHHFTGGVLGKQFDWYGVDRLCELQKGCGGKPGKFEVCKGGYKADIDRSEILLGLRYRRKQSVSDTYVYMPRPSSGTEAPNSFIPRYPITSLNMNPKQSHMRIDLLLRNHSMVGS